MPTYDSLRKVVVSGTGSNILKVGKFDQVRIQCTDTTSLAFTPKASVSGEDYTAIDLSQVPAEGDTFLYDVRGYNYLDLDVTAGTGQLVIAGIEEPSSEEIASGAGAPLGPEDYAAGTLDGDAETSGSPLTLLAAPGAGARYQGVVVVNPSQKTDATQTFTFTYGSGDTFDVVCLDGNTVAVPFKCDVNAALTAYCTTDISGNGAANVYVIYQKVRS